jgi:hypothetical protein
MPDRFPIFLYMVGALLYALIVAVLLVALVRAGHAADMGYCKVYAARSSAEVLRRLIGIPFIDETAGRFLFRKGYTYCLNSDEDPPIIMTPTEAPLLDPAPGSIPATDDPTPPPEPKPVTRPDHKVGRSGFAANSDGWVAWCKKNYASFDRSDGTVLIHKGGRRKICPG